MAVYNNYDYVAMVQAVNATLGGMYQYKWPVVTDETFGAMAAALMDAPPEIQNAYVSVMRNLICNVVIKKIYRESNPFRRLYREDSELTADGSQYIEEIAIDQFIPLAYEMDPNPERFFESAPPKVKVQFLCNVLRKKYVVTINSYMLASAFTNLARFDAFFRGIETRMYRDMEEDDKEEIMAAIDWVIRGGNMRIIPATRPVDSPSALEFSKKIDVISRDLAFKRRRDFNLQRLSTKTAEEDAIMLVAGDVLAVQNNYNLAWAFNRSYLDLADKGQIIAVDSDGFCDNKAFLIYTDVDWFRIHMVKGFPTLRTWDNGETLEQKRWLHNWKMVNFSYASNALCFVEPKDIGVQSVVLKGARGTTDTVSANVKKGHFYTLGIPDVTAVEGKLADSFVKYTMAGNTSDFTRLDQDGTIYVSKDETADTITITGTSFLDSSKSGTFTINVK